VIAESGSIISSRSTRLIADNLVGPGSESTMSMTKCGRFTPMLLCCWFATVAASAAQTITEPFLGIRHIFQTETSPRPLKIHVIEIDLSAPGLSFRVTPRSSSYPGPNINGSPGETNHQTTRAFANAVGAQAAINGAFYASSGSWANNLGLTSSNGDKYSPWELPPNSDNNFDFALNVTQANQAQIVQMANSIPTGFETNPVVSVYNTIPGSHRIVQNGSAVSITGGAGSPLTAQPRTAVGLTSGNSKLILVTVDGRQTGISEGLTLPEMASLMINTYSVTNAINLDGGGSTTMVMNFYGDGLASQVVNVPSDGSERAVGTNFGVFALPNGDFNQDGNIDAADYIVWRKTIGGQFAYDAWSERFAEPAGGTGGSAQVPEPATAILVLLMVAVLSAPYRTVSSCR
jgi:hypothetical protein